MTDLFSLLEDAQIERCITFSDVETGLRAVLVIDDTSQGPAVGGVRTQPYPSFEAAVVEGKRLAKAMTQKCALAGLGAGGGQVTVLDHPGLKREAAFQKLGSFIEGLEGLFRTSGDLGTTQADLRAMARSTRYVQSDEDRLAKAVASGLIRCIEAIQQLRGSAARVEGLTVAIQGAGIIGASAAHALTAEGATVIISDLVPERAERVAATAGAKVVSPDEILEADVDVFAPCAASNWLDVEAAELLNAKAVCGAANGVLTGVDAAKRLAARGILHVPDSIASAGAVVEDIGRTVMGLPDRTPLLDHLGTTALAVLKNARETGITPYEAAAKLAAERLAR